MLLGTDIASSLTTLESLAVDVIGLNCSTGPEHMREPIRYLTANASRPISCIPNAGLPLNTGTGDAVYPLEPAPMAEMLGEMVAGGVRVVGGCCGTTPLHLAAIVKAVASGSHHERSEGSAFGRRDQMQFPRSLRDLVMTMRPPRLAFTRRAPASSNRPIPPT